MSTIKSETIELRPVILIERNFGEGKENEEARLDGLENSGNSENSIEKCSEKEIRRSKRNYSYSITPHRSWW